MTNPFTKGRLLVCVSDNFPFIPEYGGYRETVNKPKVGEELVVDEVLGEFVRFDCYDTEDAYNWWYHDRFAPIDSVVELAKPNYLAKDGSIQRGIPYNENGTIRYFTIKQ